MSFNPLMVTLPHISGRLKVLGIGGAKRSAVLPDVPTIAEAGVSDYEVNNWWGVMVPAGTSPDILKRLHTEISAILTFPDTPKWFASQGAEAAKMSPDQFGKLVVAEIAKWGKVVKEMAYARNRNLAWLSGRAVLSYVLAHNAKLSPQQEAR